MMENKEFNVANIDLTEGVLEIDSTAYSKVCKHYDVKIEDIGDGLFRVTGNKPKLVGNYPSLGQRAKISIDEVDIRDLRNKKHWFSEDTIEMVEGYVELKERETRVYTTNKILIIE